MFGHNTSTRVVSSLLTVAALLVCLGPLSAQESPAARVLVLTGQVSVLRDSMPWALQVGSEVQPKQIVVTGPEGYAEFQVSDGSTFEVFPNSRTVFRASPGNWKDLLDVLIGRVKVHIQKLNGQPNHNRVQTPTAVISVRGTIFDVAVEDADDTTLVSVEEGEVAVRHTLQPGEPRILGPGDWIRVFRNQPLAAKQTDKGAVVQGALRAAAQALYDLVYRRPGGGSAGSTGSTGGVSTPSADRGKDSGTTGDTTAPPAPPPAPPPPPAAPPPPTN